MKAAGCPIWQVDVRDVAPDMVGYRCRVHLQFCIHVFNTTPQQRGSGAKPTLYGPCDLTTLPVCCNELTGDIKLLLFFHCDTRQIYI